MGAREEAGRWPRCTMYDQYRVYDQFTHQFTKLFTDTVPCIYIIGEGTPVLRVNVKRI